MKKILREIERFFSKITDRFFLTENFHKYQIKYSGIYSNKYKLEKDQYCLIHPPKSAGTALNEHLKKNNVFIYNSAHCLVSKFNNPDKFKYITIIRDPINRIKSFYEMQLGNKKLAFHNHSKKGIDYFVEKLTINQNCLCKFIIGDLENDITDEKYEIAVRNLKNFWFLLSFENFENDVESLSQRLNIDRKIKHIGKKEKKK